MSPQPLKNMIAFHGKKTIKDKYLKRVKAHAKADKIIKGTHWENGKGCAVGCTIEGDDHTKYETELGIPAQIANIEDSLFEALPNELAMTFPIRFLESVPVGADLSFVAAKLMIWQFEDKKYGIKHIKPVKDDEELLQVCEDVVSAYKRVIAGEEVLEAEWNELYRRADDGEARARARAGAGARAWAWAGAGARARAWAWAWAWAGAGAGADYDRLYAECITATSEKLLELLKEAPVEKALLELKGE